MPGPICAISISASQRRALLIFILLVSAMT
jgi:hypothetical protein